MVHAYALSRAKLKALKSIRNEKGGIAVPPIHNSIINAFAMIDGLKLAFYCLNYFPLLDKLNCKPTMDIHFDTSEVKYPIKFQYRHLHGKVWETGRIELRGSLQKFLKGENHSDFTIKEILHSITLLCETFKVEPAQVSIHNIEIGLNIIPAISAFQLSKRAIAYSNMQFAPMKCYGQDKRHVGFEACAQQYTLKIYDKAKQAQISGNILRYELAVNRMTYLKRLRPYTLKDITNKELLEGLMELLLETFAEVVFKEDVNAHLLNTDEKNIYADCINPKEYAALSNKKRCIRKTQYADLLKAHATTEYAKGIAAQLAAKGGGLLN